MRHDNDNGRPISFISMFSGIEAASVAFGPLGWKAICFAEIEKFPSAVLAHHYPDVPNVGDMSKHDWSQYAGKVDIVCGGPPCQDFSIAGLRAGLDGERGNLSIVYMRALHAIKPRNAIVENVPGWLNDKKNAFGCFLAGLVGADDSLRTPDGKSWPNAGMVAGPLGRAAWRVLDAQYFGLAQRRRRVIVVADFGNGADPAAVLFERKGLFGNPPPSREAGKDLAGTAKGGAGGGGDKRVAFALGSHAGAADGDQTNRSHATGGPVGSCISEELAYSLRAGRTQAVGYAPEIARCDATREGSSQDYETTAMVAVEVAPTVRAGGNRTGGDRPYGMDVDTCDSLAVVAFGWQNSASQGDGVSTEVVPTLDKSKTPAVAFVQNSRDEVRLMGGDGQIVGALAAEPGAKQQCYLAVTVAIRGRDGGHTNSHANAGVMPAICEVRPINTQVGLRHQSLGERTGLGIGDDGDPSFTLSKSHSHAVQVSSAVRRLTPRECERLQGFQWLCDPTYPGAWQDEAGRWWSPDYTAIPWRGKPADECPDGPRYRALGNSWAVPKFVWLGKRLQRLLAAIANDNTPAKESA